MTHNNGKQTMEFILYKTRQKTRENKNIHLCFVSIQTNQRMTVRLDEVRAVDSHIMVPLVQDKAALLC